MTKVDVRVKRLHADAVIPKYAHEDDICFDLIAMEDVVIEPGGTEVIGTGLALQQPKDWAIEIRPRSGISSKTKLRIANSPGTIDQYTGEIGVIIDNIAQKEIYGVDLTKQEITYWMTDYPDRLNGKQENDWLYFGDYPRGTVVIRKGDKIAQALVTPAYKANFVVVDELDDTTRGTGGFGSTGVKSAYDNAVNTNGGALERLAKEGE